ncbi:MULTISPECIES: hypothetical protein [unclassified Agrococcus]
MDVDLKMNRRRQRYTRHREVLARFEPYISPVSLVVSLAALLVAVTR